MRSNSYKQIKMPGRPSSVISFNSVDSSISSLKNCQAYINTGMEIATNVALELLETESDEGEVKNMENVMLEYAAMDRELNQFIQAVEDTTHQIRREQPEAIPDLKTLVKERFAELKSRNTDLDLKRNDKYVQFKEQLREMGKQICLPEDASDEQTIEQLDEDITVTQSQLNFICPITQLEMKRPMKNKVCGHVYEEEAIIRMIQNRHQKNKKARCPKVGCDHGDMKVTDLVLDTSLKRAIDNQNKQKGRQH
ncbi:E3 SUMO-protein ligase NSE2 isoform X2 [Ambystoma mexicanum]|uniref:E3 SUMO-protein ligase NSE2 isoform X2 n=2 Tax=Ambystoma mexicanum TaxID=8296 RepID=UPI0037E9344C